MSASEGVGCPVMAGATTPRSTAPTAGAVTKLWNSMLLIWFLKNGSANKGAVAALSTPDVPAME
jgi:hypothetical protein